MNCTNSTAMCVKGIILQFPIICIKNSEYNFLNLLFDLSKSLYDRIKSIVLKFSAHYLLRIYFYLSSRNRIISSMSMIFTSFFPVGHNKFY